MSEQQRRTPSAVGFFRVFLLHAIFLAVALAGCTSRAHTSDPRLQPMDAWLDSQLPQGTPKSRVIFFLSSQGFPQESARDARVLVGVVHHVNTATLQPATARVTFHFDASDKLKSYELESAADSPPQP